MKVRIFFLFLFLRLCNVNSQYWEQGLEIGYIPINGSTVEQTDFHASVDNMKVTDLNEYLLFVAIRYGGYIPLIKLGEIQSFGLYSSLSAGGGRGSSNVDYGALFTIPIHAMYRVGLGNRRYSESIFGFGLGLGSSFTGMVLGIPKEDYDSQTLGYFKPNVQFDFTYELLNGTKLKLNFNVLGLEYRESYYSGLLNLDYGYSLRYYSITLSTIKRL